MMKLTFTLVFVFSILGLTVGLQQFGQSCEVDSKQNETTCDQELGLHCSSSLKVCHCNSINGTDAAESVQLIWSHHECRIKVNDVCHVSSNSSSLNETHTENPTDSPFAKYHCIHRAECLNTTCQCVKGYHPSPDFVACKNGAFSISGIHLFVFTMIGALIAKDL